MLLKFFSHLYHTTCFRKNLVVELNSVLFMCLVCLRLLNEKCVVHLSAALIFFFTLILVLRMML